MRDWLDFDDIERLEASARTPKAHRRAAATLAGWAQEPNPDDEVTPADLMSAAAWHVDQAGDTEGALALLRQAVAAGGTTTPDARSLLHAALLAADRPDEARRVADEFRRSRPRTSDCADMAENFELNGNLGQAHRWAEMGVNRLELGVEEDDDVGVISLLNVRRSVRQRLGFPPDELDETRP